LSSPRISIVRHTWPDNWGPRSEGILEHAAIALLKSAEPATLIALPRILSDAAYRASILTPVTDPAVRAFFAFFEKQNDGVIADNIIHIGSHIAAQVSN
jgi:hypothetical protein